MSDSLNSYADLADPGNMDGHGCHGHICSIIPLELLEKIVTSDTAHPDAKAAAQHTLSQTQELRDNRLTFMARLAAPSAPSAGGGPQSIIPSDLLESVATADVVDSETSEGAQKSLQLSEEVRSKRSEHSESLLAKKSKKPHPPPPPSSERLIYTASHTTILPGTLTLSEGGATPTSDVSIDECYDGLGYMRDFISQVFHRTSIDDMGMPLIGTVHYGTKFNNAFWDGQQMVFGDGDGVIFNRFTTSVDVIGHELTHGITSYTANLLYSGQSGALNESVSDCFGSMLKQYHLKQCSEDADWLIGEGLFTSQIKAVALRSMKAPGTAYDDPHLGKDKQPSHMSNYINTTADNGGVHTNSGIPNFAFYKVSIGLGGNSWEKPGRIWYAALNDRGLKRNADFKMFADVTCANALTLYDQATQDVVRKAWVEVGVYEDESEEGEEVEDADGEGGKDVRGEVEVTVNV